MKNKNLFIYLLFIPSALIIVGSLVISAINPELNPRAVALVLATLFAPVTFFLILAHSRRLGAIARQEEEERKNVEERKKLLKDTATMLRKLETKRSTENHQF